ncbi:hypothetical protein ABEB36_010868 [Hypothenemus hampei]|uniref:Conserved oligomeric Golgi complex subunit 2 n=1 Tax=Hypothenemus hampei TaxID=57062 RepID=A0ABD1EDB3_HYPHA
MDSNDIDLWKQKFFQSSFNVDQCLAEYTQKSDLESLRKDLKKFAAELQLQMADILKNETEAIVNLAEYLTNLDSKINNLSTPIRQLREEVWRLYDVMKLAVTNYEVVLLDIKFNNSKQSHIHLKLGILSECIYINSIISQIENNVIEHSHTLEHIVSKYSFQKTYLDELNLITPDIEKAVLKILAQLTDNVNKCFLKALNNGQKDTILKCLRMYVDLQQQNVAYDIFRENILKPLLQPILTEKYLEQCNNDISIIYDEVKEILNTKVDFLEIIVQANTDIKSLNFVVNSFWKQFDVSSREGLPHITAPGNPDLFQKRFTNTYNLLKYISAKANNEELLKEDESFKNYLKRFNLPVYFEIKFQQIAGNFETETINLTLNNIDALENEHSLKLKSSVILWNSIKTTFDKDVYIDQLADQFIRLAMMLLSRHSILMKNILEHTSGSNTTAEVDLFIINVLSDLEILRSLMVIENPVFSILNEKMQGILIKVFKSNEKTFGKIRNVFTEYFTTSKINYSASHLQNVTAIPRLFRRTNRNPPTEASSYMVQALEPIINLAKVYESKFYLIKDVIEEIIAQISFKYLTLVQEVLRSVYKIEESLRRMKSGHASSTDDPNRGSSDETKIREQIKYDVKYFYDKLYHMGSEAAKESMDALQKEVLK